MQKPASALGSTMRTGRTTSSVRSGRWQVSLRGGAQERECGGAAVCSSLSGVRLWSDLLLQAGVYIYRELSLATLHAARQSATTRRSERWRFLAEKQIAVGQKSGNVAGQVATGQLESCSGK